MKRIYLLIIIILGSVLRFWDFPNIPFTYDEFSAISRTPYNSFSELIANGVWIDRHPAGVQVFLYYWIKLGGVSEAWIKLPFTLLGIGSILLGWKIGKDWFSENVAMLIATTLAFMQYFIIYSQIARPYISGLFFTLMMVFFWYRTLFHEKISIKKSLIDSMGFTIGAALCSYNHYFSLLMAGLVSFIGFIYINKKNAKWYIGSLLLIMLLYLPHLPIFFYHLSLKGLEWLGAPTIFFIFNYFQYLTHFNLIVLFFLISVILFGVLRFIKNKEIFTKEQFISLFLGISPFIIGYLYSVLRAPVLQYSVLIFSAPFLFMFFFSFLKTTEKKYVHLIAFTWSLLLIYSLIFTRKHYDLFYKSIYEEGFKTIKENMSDSTIYICNFEHHIKSYYINKLKIDSTTNVICYPHSLKSKKDLYELFNNPKYKRLILLLANGTPSLYSLCREYFPNIKLNKYLDEGEICIFERGNPSYDLYTHISTNFFKGTSNWVYKQENIKNDSVMGIFYCIDTSDLYDIHYELSNTKEIYSHSQVVDISAWVYLPDNFNNKAYMVAEIKKDSLLWWQGCEINSQELPKKKWVAISMALFLPDINVPLDSIKVKTYFWNPERNKFFVNKTFFGVRKGNKYTYWIIHDVFK